jgi:hypothetical protein
VIPVALERIEAFEIREVRFGEAANSGDEELGRYIGSIVGTDLPGSGVLVECSRRDFSSEVNVLAQI